MGTDIHPVVQVRRHGAWNSVDAPSELCDRRYQLFAVLANVRNGYGFAGVVTGDPVTPIAEPRGLPEDFQLKDEETSLDGTWMGDHTHSWVTLAELEAYSWQAPLRRQGVLPLAEFLTWPRGTRPHHWSGGVMGRRVVTLTPEAIDRGAHLALDADIYVQVDWLETLGEAVGWFYEKGLPWLRTLGAPDDVRLVFGFDS